jgi:exodeoxyribonuclease VII small subunit
MTGDEEKFEQLSMFAPSQQEIPNTASDTKVKKAKTLQTRSKAPPSNSLSLSPGPGLGLDPSPSQSPSQSPSKPKEKSPMQTVEPGIDFEAALTQLETVVKELDGEVKLEQALKLFEEGIKLSVECEKFIKSAEQKIEILKKQADGSQEPESFAHETEKLLAGE